MLQYSFSLVDCLLLRGHYPSHLPQLLKFDPSESFRLQVRDHFTRLTIFQCCYCSPALI